MTRKKLLLTLATVSILCTGCDEKETTTKPTVDTTPTEKITKVVQKPESSPIKESKVVEKKITAPIEKKVVSAPDAATLYKKCSACHGLKAEKKALGKSAILKDWDAAMIAKALKGYKNGTYGGAMKGIMKGQVTNLSNKEMELLAHHIENLK